jgi:hypothetical protein
LYFIAGFFEENAVVNCQAELIFLTKLPENSIDKDLAFEPHHVVRESPVIGALNAPKTAWQDISTSPAGLALGDSAYSCFHFRHAEESGTPVVTNSR